MNKEKYNIGVIGVGVWGCHTLEHALVDTGYCRIFSVCGNDLLGEAVHDDPLAAAMKYAENVNAKFVENPDDIIADPDIDIVSVMVAPKYKSEFIVKALKKNKYIVTDKPLGLTVAEAEAICEAEKESEARGFMLCGYHTRPAGKKLLEHIRSGRLGDIKAVSVRLNFTRCGGGGFTPGVKWRDEVPGGESVTIGTHGLMTAMKLAGSDVVDFFRVRKNDFYDSYQKVGIDDYAIYNLKFANGAVGNVSVGRVPYSIPNEDIVIEVTGTDGYAEINGTSLKTYPDGNEFHGTFDVPELLKGIFSEFIESIGNEKGSVPTSFEDGLKLQKIIV